MPLDAPLSLTDDEVYAVTAYVLSLNGIIADDADMNAKSSGQVQMPNRDGFVSQWPEYTPGSSEKPPALPPQRALVAGIAPIKQIHTVSVNVQDRHDVCDPHRPR